MDVPTTNFVRAGSLDELKAAAARAADVFKDSCTESYALTPPGRLRAMINRVNATLEAVKIVQPALENLYSSLSDEQQASFNALGPRVGEESERARSALGNRHDESLLRQGLGERGAEGGIVVDDEDAMSHRACGIVSVYRCGAAPPGRAKAPDASRS